MSKNTLISIVIANYNGKKYLRDCLNSVVKTTYQNYEVIIIDDGSTDSSTRIIESYIKKHKHFRLFKNERNKGAAASRNVAIKKTTGNIIVFLDNDTEVQASWLTHMVKELAPKNIGACQSRLMDFEKRKLIQNTGVKLWAATAWGLPQHQWKSYKKGLIKKQDLEIIAISAALAVKREVVEKIGGFDEDEAVVTEDLDFSWRIWLAGYKMVLAEKSVVYHWTKAVEMRKNLRHSAAVIYYHLTKNSLTSIIKNYEAVNSIKFFFICILISMGRAALVLIKKHDTAAIKGTLKGFLYIMSHFNKILLKRKKIQSIRKYTDEFLFKKVICNLHLTKIYKLYFSQTKLI